MKTIHLTQLKMTTDSRVAGKGQNKRICLLLMKGVLMLLMLIMAAPLKAQNQVSIQVVVPPPYSPKLSSYVYNPNRIVLTLINTTGTPREIYLHGKFASDDESIVVQTSNTFKPTQSLHLDAYETLQASIDDLAGIFDESSLTYTGITEEELINNQGVPEGSYKFCFEAFDYASSMPVSQNTCSNVFEIRYVDPPIIISPVCGDSITETQPQNVVISWTFPVGAVPGTVEFNVQMVEMFPEDRNPNEALQVTGRPYFLNVMTNINSLIIGPSEPDLIPGRSYAFLIQAIDESGDLVFRNFGKSEACWFKYKEHTMLPLDTLGDSFVDIDLGLDDFIDDFEVLPSTTVSGQLFYKLASDANAGTTGGESTPSGNQYNNGGTNYDEMMDNDMQNGGNANTNNFTFGGMGGFNFNQQSFTGDMVLKPPFGSGFINANVIDQGGAEPLANMMVRLVVRYSKKESDSFTRVNLVYDGTQNITLDVNNAVFYNLKGERISSDKVLSTVGQVLGVTTTDNAGNYSFNFWTDFFTGPVYVYSQGNTGDFGQSSYQGVISLRVEVLNKKFCSPDVDIFAMPGDQLQVPPQVSLIKDFGMDFLVLSAYDVVGSGDGHDTILREGYDETPKKIPGGKPIPNATVKIMRSVQELGNECPAILLAEGQQLGSTTNNENGEFKNVFIGKTDNDGKVRVSRLVSDWITTSGSESGYNITPYYLSVRVRTEQADSTYEDTFYNFDSYFGKLIFKKPGLENAEQGYWYWNQSIVYNHYYAPPPSVKRTGVKLKALPPEIKGRLMVKTNLENIGLADERVDLNAYYTNEPGAGALKDTIVYTNNAGFFRFTNLSVNVDEHGNARGPYRRIYAMPRLYKGEFFPPKDKPPFNLVYGELKFHEFDLVPEHLLKGKVVDETGAAVAAYVRVLENNPYVKTTPVYEYDNNGNIYVEAENFEVAAAAKGNRIEVLPLSGSYFPDTITIDRPENMITRVPLRVYRKMHRLSLVVKNKVTNAAISNADVVVGDTLAYGRTNENGRVELIFPSPGEQFLVKISAADYTPTQVSFNVPVSNDWQYRSVKLEPSMSISGVITEKTSGQAIDSALVYIRLQSTDGHNVYLEGYSGANGHYTLTGIPLTLTTVDVHVVKNGNNPSYIGVTKTINVEPFAYPVPSYDFQLKAIDWDLSQIWGFPVIVEHFSSKNNNGAVISGYFFNLPHKQGFELLNSDEKVYFKDVSVLRADDGKISPENNVVETESYFLPVKISGGFEGKYFVPAHWMSPKTLKIIKNGDRGKMAGALKLDLASFKFAYDFHGDFYLGDDTTNYAFPVFRSVFAGGGGFVLLKHFVYDLDANHKPVPIDNFRVFGFNASSSFSGAYYKDDVIHIGAILHTNIPMANASPLDLKIHAGEIAVTRDNIEMIPNQDSQLSFDLEKWKVESKEGWFFDKTRDAIVIPKGIVYTGLGVDASIQGLNIRRDALREGEIDMQGGLSLGGIAVLTTASGLKPVFNFDAGVGHYRISMVGNSEGPAAWLDNLPATSDRLKINSIGMLSDNSSVLNIACQMRFHNVLDIFVDQIMTGSGFFKLSGMPELGIPGFIPASAEVTYTKPNGKLKEKLEPISGVVDCNANVSYKLKQEDGAQAITKNKYTSEGTFFIKPPPGESGDEFEIEGLLTKTPNSCVIDVVPQQIKIGKEKMNVTEGNISVASEKWGNLTFDAHTNSTGLDDENTISFLVHGGIQANGDNIKVDQIETPLGNLNLAYHFSEKALVGDLTINGPLDMGFATINNGGMAMQFDPSGFFMMFMGNVKITQQEYLGGFVLGVYSKDLTSKASSILKGFEKNPPSLTTLHGFYAIGQRNLINADFPIPSAPPVWVTVKAGIGAYVNFDYYNPKFVVGGYAFAKARGGIDVPLCGFVGASASAFFDVEGGYEHQALFIQTCGLLNVSVGACGLGGSISVLNRNRLSSNGNNEMTLKLGGSCQ